MMRTTVASAALVLVAGLSAGCPSRDVSAVDPRQAKEQEKEIPINLSRDIDILFVVDNSGSMQEEQDSLRANFPAFINVLEEIEGGLPSSHIAVVSSDMGIGQFDAGNCAGSGDNGSFQTGSGCALSGGDAFITTDPSNFSGALEDQFSCMANLGTSGCGFEQHLASMKAALDDNPANAGFLRDDAYLAVIFIADEDDCSAKEGSNGEVYDPDQNAVDAEFGFFSSFRCWEYGVVCDGDSIDPRDMPDDGTPSGRTDCVPRDDSAYIEQVQKYVDFLKGLKDDPKRVLVAGIIGDPEPTRVQRKNEDMDADIERVLMPACSSGSGEAAPSTRLTAFLESFPDRNVFQTICEDDLTGGLTQIAELLRRVTGTPCIEGELYDADPDAAGIQPDCRVSDVSNYGSDNAVETSIKPCSIADSDEPCYTITEDAANCSTFPTQLSISVDYRGGTEAPETTRVVRCAAE